MLPWTGCNRQSAYLWQLPAPRQRGRKWTLRWIKGHYGRVFASRGDASVTAARRQQEEEQWKDRGELPTFAQSRVLRFNAERSWRVWVNCFLNIWACWYFVWELWLPEVEIQSAVISWLIQKQSTYIFQSYFWLIVQTVLVLDVCCVSLSRDFFVFCSGKKFLLAVLLLALVSLAFCSHLKPKHETSFGFASCDHL